MTGRLICAGLLAAACVAALAVELPGGRQEAHADTAAGSVLVDPEVGIAENADLLGSAPLGAAADPAEAWALPSTTPRTPPVVAGHPLTGSVLFLQYTAADGWHYAESAADVGGNGDYTDGEPLSRERSGRVTPRGGLALVVGAKGDAKAATLVLGDRGQRPQAVAPPGLTILPDPEDPSLSREFLSATVLAAVDGPEDHTIGYVAIEGRQRQRAIARYGAGGWTREPICVADATGVAPPPCTAAGTLTGSSAQFDVVALSVSGSGAWMLGRADPDADPSVRRGLVLFQRVTTGGAPRWQLRDIGTPVFQHGDAARGVTDVAPQSSPSALTATPDGVWVDGTFQQRGVASDVTVFFDGKPGGATTWCDGDAGLCDHPFGVRFGDGYRSFAWAGGERVITDVKQSGDTRTVLGPGDYVTLEGTSFVRHPAFNNRFGRGAAFGAPDEGWLGTSHITRTPPTSDMTSWPIPVRQPLTAITGAPGEPPGALDSPALAVGLGGSVLRYTPGQGWDAEPLLGSSGASQDDLRGVAWPSDDFAFAVGDNGAMWRWRRTTGLWEADPGTPFDFQGDLMGIAFAPGDANRGFAVGRQGVLLRYDKSWTPQTLPSELATSGPGGGPADLYSVAFAGQQALVAAGSSLLVSEGDSWSIDASAQKLLDDTGGKIYAVAGLADGGAVAAGRGVVLIRDGGPGTPWRLTDQPLVVDDPTITAVAAVRDGAQVRAVVALDPSQWPSNEDTILPVTDPDQPPPRPTAIAPSPFAGLLRETDAGWQDEEHSLFDTPGIDNARKTDPVAGFLLDASGKGWIVGGWDGFQDTLGNGQARTAGGDDFTARDVSTASVLRYAPAGGAENPPTRQAAPISTPPGPVRLLVGGHAECEDPCAQSAQLGLMPDETLSRAVTEATALAAQPGGPRALLYTGGRLDPSGGAVSSTGELQRLGELLGSGDAKPPVFGTVAPADSAGGSAQPFEDAFAAFPAPFGTGAAASGTTPLELGAPATAGKARTHYAVDLQGPEGTVRIVVIDNAPGSLAAADPYQNPPEPQQPWLKHVLADARAAGTPVIVMGARSLNTSEPHPDDRARVASDAGTVAALLRDGGASAYVYDADEKQVIGSIPSGDSDTIPTFGSGTLGYRPSNDVQAFGVPALTMLELDLTHRDPATDRVPVAPRLIPVIEDLALEAVDGRILNRSQPALFRGLGRRPRSGDRWSLSVRGSSPYVQLPNPACAGGCAGRLDPEVRFTSSDPDIADFVRQDPTSANPRKPFVDPKTDKPVPDATSGLLCSFNAGTTTVSVAAAGIAYSTTVTIRNGSVLRPCGTVPLAPGRFPQPAPAPSTVAPAVPATGPGPQPNATVNIPVPVPSAVSAAAPAPSPVPFVPVPTLSAPFGAILPPPAVTPRPIPPSGTSPSPSSSSVLQPATRVEKEREEEIAPESQQSAVRYDAGETRVIGGAVIGLVLCAALAGTSLRQRHRPRDRGQELARSYSRVPPRGPWRPE